jgi:hypothetical protein
MVPYNCGPSNGIKLQRIFHTYVNSKHQQKANIAGQEISQLALQTWLSTVPLETCLIALHEQVNADTYTLLAPGSS